MIRIELFTKSETLPPLLDGDPLHSAMMFSIVECSSKAKPYMFVCYEGDKEIAHLLAAKQRQFRLIPPGLYTWYSVYGKGVYCDDCKNKEEIFAMFIDKLLELFDFHHTFIEIRNLPDSRFAYGALSDKGFFPRKCIRIYNSLHSRNPQERLTRAYRSHIKKAEMRGVTYARATTTEEIDAGVRLLRNYYMSKIRRHFPPEKIVRKILLDDSGSPMEQTGLFIVRFKEKIIGCSLCFYEGTRAHLAFSCGLRKRHPLLYPGIMAIWAAITDAYQRGYEHFEFSESNLLSRHKSGYINLILNFGGKQVSTMRWFRFKWHWLNKISRAIYV